LDRDDVAEAAGVERAFVARLVEAGILAPADAGAFTLGDVRRVALVDALERGGLPVEVIAEAIRQGRLTLDFVDQPGYGFLATLQPTTFRDVSAETRIPLELLLVVREAMGFAQADPDDRMRSQEAEVVTLLRLLVDHGVRPPIIERLLRVSADSLRRIAETESDLWRTDLLEPMFAAGKSADEIGRITNDIAAEYAAASDRSLLAIAHGQGAHTWLRNIFEGFERTLIDAGLYAAPGVPPAICFLDVTGYTRLTEVRGDAAAAGLAERLGRIVQRTSAGHGGKAVKWLGDGVMFYFRQPGQGVQAALEMVAAARAAELPPAHVGLHAGRVLFQEGDYFGRTVNTAARIAEYARQGEVL
jgi:adenylate cyclase